MALTLDDLPLRFKAKVRVTDRYPIGLDRGPCWEWLGCKTPRGYGQYFPPRSRGYAHRFSYEFYNGSIPIGLEPDHLCRWTSCVNPAHIEPVTHSENMRRSARYHLYRPIPYSAEKTHCPKGHPYDSVNTYYRPERKGRPGKPGGRGCKTCRKEAQRPQPGTLSPLITGH